MGSASSMRFGNRHPAESWLGGTTGLILLTYILSIFIHAFVCVRARTLCIIIHTYDTSKAESMISIASCKTTSRQGLKAQNLFSLLI